MNFWSPGVKFCLIYSVMNPSPISRLTAVFQIHRKTTLAYMCRNSKLTQQCSLHTRKKLSPVWYDTKPPSHIRHTMDNVIFLFSKWAVNNSLACFFFFWIQLDNDASISSISCQNADALVTLLLIFFSIWDLWWGLPLLLFKAAFPSHEVTLSWKSLFQIHSGAQ